MFCGSMEASQGRIGACGQAPIQNLEVCKFEGGVEEDEWGVEEKPKIGLSSKKGEVRPEESQKKLKNS